MKIAKALKVKNRLAGEVNRLRQIFTRENSKQATTDAHTKYVAETEKKVNETVEKLVAVKSAISKANIGIYEKICRMAELKGKKTFYAGLETRHGEFKVTNYQNPSDNTVNFFAHIKQEDADRIDKELQLEIDRLQDEIDEYNASCEVDFKE